jgi:pectate lyase
MHRKKILASLITTLLGGAAAAYASPVDEGFTFCANFGEMCVVPDGRRYAYLQGNNIGMYTEFQTSVVCNDAAFEQDPPINTAGSCWIGELVNDGSDPVLTPTPTPTPTPNSSSSSSSSSSGGEQFPTQIPPRAQVGYANVAISSTITGNISGPTVTVKTFAELKAAAVATGASTILVSGTLRGSGVVNIAGFKIVRGLPGAVLDGFGLGVNGVSTAYNDTAACDAATYDYYARTRNVVIQNLTFKNTPDVAVRLSCGAHHVWIDHNTITKPGTAGISITRGADYVTASWNRISNADKALLVGHENSARQVAQSKGHLHLSYHHNWHENTAQTQSLTYYGTVHAYNNYVQGAPASYFLGIANDASIYAEANSVVSVGSACKAFEGASRSHVTFLSTNIVLDQNGKDLSCKVVNDGTAIKPPYSGYPLDAVGNVPVIVKQGAGAGKIVF